MTRRGGGPAGSGDLFCRPPAATTPRSARRSCVEPTRLHDHGSLRTGEWQNNPPATQVPASSSSRPLACDKPLVQAHLPRLAARRTPAPSRQAYGPLILGSAPLPVAATGTCYDQPRPVRACAPRARSLPLPCRPDVQEGRLAVFDWAG